MKKYIVEVSCNLEYKSLEDWLNKKFEEGYELVSILNYNKDIKTGAYLFKNIKN